MTHELTSVEPKYGVNYKVGYSFGTFNDKSFISKGIAWFTRFDYANMPKVSHVGFVADEATALESHASTGVSLNHLAEYFDDPHTHIFFRKPHPWTEDMGGYLIKRGMAKLGAKYDFGLIKAHLIAGTFLGHGINHLSNGRFEKWLCKVMNSKSKWICSEFCTWAMQGFPEWCGKGILSQKAYTVTPREYIWDLELFGALKDTARIV
jgi:hypothetical protein